MKNLEQFRELFNPLPGNHYLHVTTEIDEISFLFEKMMQEVGGEFNLALYKEKDENDILRLPNSNIQHVSGFSKPFRAIPRDHDTVVLKDIFYVHENKNMILKNAYLTLANTANIIIIEKKGLIDVMQTKEMLQEHEFRAANEIDILEGYDLITAKKMHMWGNGL